MLQALKSLGALLVSPFISWQFGLTKLYKLAANIYHRGSYKIDRNFNRLLYSGIFGYAGLQTGIQYGALAGTLLFPGPGALVGSVVGGFLGLGFGLVTGIVFAKQIHRVASWLDSTEGSSDLPTVNRTNPQKYSMASDRLIKNEYDSQIYYRTSDSVERPYDSAHKIFKLLYKAKTENKNRISFLGSISSWFATDEDKKCLKKNADFSEAIHNFRTKGEANFHKHDSGAGTNYAIDVKIDNNRFFRLPCVASRLPGGLDEPDKIYLTGEVLAARKLGV